MTRARVSFCSPTSFLPGQSRHHCSVRKSRILGRKTDHILKSRNNSITISFIGAWIIAVDPPHRAGFLFSLPAQRGSFRPLNSSARTKSASATSRQGTAGTALGHIVLRLLCLNELQRTANCIGLTKASSAGYACIRKGASRCSDSTATPSGSFPANSWRSWERSRVLTPFQGRFVERLWRVRCGRFADRSRLPFAVNSCAQRLLAPAFFCSVAVISEFPLSVSGQELEAA